MKLTEKRCGHCRFCFAVDQPNAHCRRAPPYVVNPGGGSSYPMVNTAAWWCGEYRRDWWRWLKSLLK
jgi:hypothetical protein